MIVTFKNMLQAYSGTCNGIVYYYNSRYGKYIARRAPKYKPNSATNRMAEISRNLKRLDPSPGYIMDLQIYTQLLRNLPGQEYNGCTGWSNVFNKLMWALARAFDVDLRFLDRDMIISQCLPVNSVKEAVEAGLLPEVPGFELLVRELVD